MSRHPSVAKNRWREFEKLAVELVEDGFRVQPDVVRVTRPSKDGGFDGYIDLILADGIGGSIRHRTLLEAKLRSRAGGVGLRTVAATMVIAYNEAAQSLFLVTNGTFTGQSLEHISIFLAKTNLAVHLVDGRTLAGWVRRHLYRLRTTYSQDLLDLLAPPEGESEAANYIECRRQDLLRDRKNRSRIFDPPSVKVKTGWLEDGRMADCRVILEWTEIVRDEEAFPPLVGRKRQETVEQLVRSLEARSGVAILAGPPGVGKSIVLDHLMAQSTESPEDLFSFSFVDVGQSLTSRGLFLDILAACSGIDYRIIYSDARGAIDPEYLVARTAGRETPQAIKLAVAKVLRENISGFQSSRDLTWQPLLDFLQEVATPHAKRRKTTIIFQELNRASSECLEFLVKVVQRLESAGMRVIVELRDRGNVPDSAIRSSEGERAIMSLREWEGFVQTFLRLQTCGVYRVDPLDQRETHEYLEHLLPGLGPERAEVIRARLGGIPLHLKSASVWLETERVVDRHGGELPVVEQLETFFEGIRPDHVEGLFDQLIEAWWKRPSCPLKTFLAAAALLDGRLHLQVLEILRGEQSLDVVVEQLVDSTLFAWSRQAHDQLEVSHDLLRERISHFAVRQRLAQRHVAEKLLPYVEEIWADPLLQRLRKVDLLDALGRWEEVQELSFRVGTELSQSNEFTSASKYLSLAHEALRKLSHRDPIASTDRSHEEAEILSALLEVDAKRRRIGLDTNQRRLDALDVLLTHLRGVVESARWQELWLQKLLFSWNHHFLREEFSSAADLAERAREFVLMHDSGVPPALAGQAWIALGLTYKVLNKRTRSLQIFDEAVKRFPDLKRVRAERLSNLAAFALRDNPAQALKLYREILESEGKHEDLHTRVDVGMAWFLMGDYKNAKREGEFALRLAADRGVPAQEARARNILSCCLWAGDQTEEADRQLDLASVAAERTMFRRYLWRIRVNRSGTAWEIGQAGVAYSLARSAEEDILVPREPSFAEVGGSSEHVTSRWYAALLALGERYQHLGKPADYRRLCDRVRLPYFEEHLEAWTSSASLPEALSDTSHLHAGRIMITG